MTFADRVVARCRERNSRLVVGLDPHWHMIPEAFKQRYDNDIGTILTTYLEAAIDACLPYAVAFKPQIAFFEQFGIVGFTALEKLLAKLRQADALVIMDAKRNDIGSTAEAYARAYFGSSDRDAAFPCDALTVNAYLGVDGIAPFAQHPEKGLFVLVKTSNRSSGEFQDLAVGENKTLAHAVAMAVADWNGQTPGLEGYGNIGAVIGATWPEAMSSLRRLMPRSLILVPGFGAQGGSEEAVRAAFNPDGFGALINSSRGVLFPNDWIQDEFEAVARAARITRDRIQTLLP